VTEKAILSFLERDLVDENSIFSSRGIQQIESRIQSLFRRPDLGVSLASLKGDQVMVTKNDHHSKVDCLFSNSHHICLKDLEGSVWMPRESFPENGRHCVQGCGPVLWSV